MPPDVYAELCRAIAWLAIGFAMGVIFHPFGSGWSPDGDED